MLVLAAAAAVKIGAARLDAMLGRRYDSAHFAPQQIVLGTVHIRFNLLTRKYERKQYDTALVAS